MDIMDKDKCRKGFEKMIKKEKERWIKNEKERIKNEKEMIKYFFYYAIDNLIRSYEDKEELKRYLYSALEQIEIKWNGYGLDDIPYSIEEPL